MQKIKSIRSVGKKPVYDISVKDAEHYVLENGVVSHNTGGIYSSDGIWIVGRRQNKDGQEIIGYDFVIKIEKSRFVKEGAKIPINVTFDAGIDRWSGMFDVAVEGGYIDKPKMGWYMPMDPKTGECLSDKNLRQKEIVGNDDLWDMMLEKTDLANYIKERYTLGGKIRDESELEMTTEPLEEDESNDK